MPRVSLFTNVAASKINATALLKDLTAAAATSIGKDESKFMNLVHPDTPIYYAGSEEPAAFLEVSSIGAIGGDKNASIVSQLSGVVEKHLSIPPARVYVNFFDIKPSDWGVKGTTNEALNK